MYVVDTCLIGCWRDTVHASHKSRCLWHVAPNAQRGAGRLAITTVQRHQRHDVVCGSLVDKLAVCSQRAGHRVAPVAPVAGPWCIRRGRKVADAWEEESRDPQSFWRHQAAQFNMSVLCNRCDTLTLRAPLSYALPHRRPP